MHDIGALRGEDRSATGAATLVTRRDTITSDIWLDALKHRDAAVGLSDDGNRDPSPDTRTVPRSAEIRH